MIHYENMTKEQVISILKDTLEYAEEKDKEIESLNNELKSDENYYVRNLKAIIKEKDKEIERLKTLWEANRQNWACIMYEKEKEIETLKNKKTDFKKVISEEITKIDKNNEQEKNKMYKENKRLNNIINEMEQFFIDNANDEMKKCFDKLHSLKGSDKE